MTGLEVVIVIVFFVLISFIVIKFLKTKKTPNNKHTPFDDIVAGKKDDNTP